MFVDPLPPRPHEKRLLRGLAGSSDALAIAELANSAKPWAVITDSAADAQRLREEIAYFAPELRVLLMPDWETLPYDHFSPHEDLVSERLATLYQLSHRAFDLVMIPVTTALYRLPPTEFLAQHTFFLKTGAIDVESLRQQLVLAGYQNVTQVQAAGEYSIRGGLIDLFPMGSPLPYRLDLFGDEVESIRAFDVDTQRSIYPVNEVRLLPAREFPLNETGIAVFRQRFREQFEGDPSKSRLYKDISKGIAPPGIEYYLPLFFDHTATFFDFLPDNAMVGLHGTTAPAIERFWTDTRSRYQLLKGDRDRPLLAPEALFLRPEDFFGAADAKLRAKIVRDASPESASELLPEVSVERREDDPLIKLKQFAQEFGGRILVAAESLGRRETMTRMFEEHQFHAEPLDTFANLLDAPIGVYVGVAPLHAGFVVPSERLAIITENELYAGQVRQSRLRESARKSNVENMLRDLSEVRIGDAVVHEQHGVGRYLGLVTLDLGEGETEFLHLEYAGGDKLYVPVSNLHLINRYSGGVGEPPIIHKLGSGQWEKAKRRAKAQVRDTAAELLQLYALRAARTGHAFKIKPHDFEAFSASFQFEETADQAAAIQAVYTDMTSGKPMDRLVCGDVGFGKTEVALRAAFIAVADGKQVAVLVPTTLLAEQHFQTFSDRFGEWPVKIAELSRFRSAKETVQALKGLADGSIDIVIGTHKLLQKDMVFHNLGLVIIDEEHRFGVRQKERLKALRAEVDVLALTATPIPRTLSMSLEGLREFSVIATAPQRRLSIKTFVTPFSDGIIREAVLRELKRGGQVYFLHNEVETIGIMQEKLAKLLPEARIGVAHGQMPERELEHAMRDFYQQRFNLLLCTTIIETGIDVPTANTIIMNRADLFGLAQLHQLRGRVGRSHHQAYAYLLTEPDRKLTAQATKRLEAIQMMEDLGVGFYLAMHDLEIRGAGELLGESQSGEMQEIGFTLYSEMLNQAIEALKRGDDPEKFEQIDLSTEINLHTPALLPTTYCDDVHERLVIYKRLANCDSEDGLDAMREELIDRFGLLPEPARMLLDTHALRLASRPLGIIKIDASAEAIAIQFIANPPIDPMAIISLIQTNRHFKLNGPDRLRVTEGHADLAARITAIHRILKSLGTPAAALSA